jgi:hypothetical protein
MSSHTSMCVKREVETHDLAGTLDSLAFLNQSVGTEEHDTDLSGLEVHAHALDARCEPRALLAQFT